MQTARFFIFILSLWAGAVFAADGTVPELQCVWTVSNDALPEECATFAIGARDEKSAPVTPFLTPDGEGTQLLWDVTAAGGEPNYVADYRQGIGSLTAFSCSWKLRVYHVESGPAAREQQYTLAWKSGNFPRGAKLKVVRDSDGELLGTLGSAAGSVKFSALTAGTAGNFSAQYFTVTVECGMASASLRYTLYPGWNLIGVPFAEVTGADALFGSSTAVFTAAPPLRRLYGAEELAEGGAYWVYSDGADSAGVSVTLSGLAHTGRTSAFSDAAGDGWTSLALTGGYDESAGRFADPAAPSDGTLIFWDAPRRTFRTETGLPRLERGYFRRR